MSRFLQPEFPTTDLDDRLAGSQVYSITSYRWFIQGMHPCDEHASGMAVNQSCGVFIHAIGDQQRRFVPAESADGQLSQRVRIVAQRNAVVQHAGRGILAPDIMESGSLPAAHRPVVQLAKNRWRPTAQSQKVDVAGVEFGQVGVGGETAVKDQFFGWLTGARLPGFDEFRDGLVL